jgi:hypothetical protein
MAETIAEVKRSGKRPLRKTTIAEKRMAMSLNEPSNKRSNNPLHNNDELFHQLMYYTLAHPDPAFIHQNVVDAYAVQSANETTKNITIVFGLIGLYLSVEKNLTGKQVQKAHMHLASGPRKSSPRKSSSRKSSLRKSWFRPKLPACRGSIVIADVLAAPPGPPRDAMIRNWCASVWEACSQTRPQIAELAQKELGIG